jgi:tetratricopeptide (TPR) repeat protein
LNKIFLIIVIAVCLNLPAFASTERELFENGVNFLKQEKNQEAVDAFTKLLEIAPLNPDAFKNRGVAYMKLNRYDEAIDDFEQVKQILPNLKGLYSNLGVAWYYKKEYSKAIESYDKEIAQSPDNYYAYFNRAICRTELKEYKKSLQDIIKTLELSPDFYLALCLKGDLHWDMNQPQEARIAYEKAVLIDPDQAYAKEQLEGLMREAVLKPDVPTTQVQKEPLEMSQVPMPRVEKKEILSREIPPPITAKKTVTKAPVESRSKNLSTTPAPVYELQTGAYRVRGNAVDMLKKLERNGYKARILELTRPNHITWYLVRSGEYFREQEAQSAKIILKNKLKIEGIIRPFDRF